MKKYIYIHAGAQAPIVWSTDPSVLEWIFREIKNQIPSCEVVNVSIDLSGAIREFKLQNVNNLEHRVAETILRMFCENGFEPFAVINDQVHFRKEIVS